MKTIIVIVLAVSLLQACTVPHYVYTPPAQNVPVLTAKGNSSLGIMYSTNDKGNHIIFDNNKNTCRGLDAQAAYAVSNHIAVQACYFFRSESNGDELEYIRYKRHLLEAGAGYYVRITSKTDFQFFAGYGSGKFLITDESIDSVNLFTRYHHSDISKIYFQPAVAFSANAHRVVVILSARVSLLKYKNIQTDYTGAELANYKLSTLPGGAIVFVEPYFTNSFEFKWLPGVKIQYQFGFSVYSNSRNDLLYTRSTSFSIGALADIPKLFHKKGT